MEILKTILLALLVCIVLGAVAVKYALNSGMHVPTNKELIGIAKAMQEERKAPKQEPKTVKATDIKSLKKAKKADESIS